MINQKLVKNKNCLHDVIIELMKRLDLWEDELEDEIPTSFENYGGLILINSSSFSNAKWRLAGDELWSSVCSALKGDRVALKGHIKDDLFRTPQVTLVYGNSSIATFIDNGIKYRWDVEKTMFSKGNVTERHRIARLDCTDEVIVDLFAGIGYFTLPYLVKANAKHVHACEWNPDALDSLRQNLSLNKVSERCTIHEGDNRLISLKNVANRVNLGLIPSSEESWEAACQALLQSGGILYVHQNVESNVHVPDSIYCEDCASYLKDLPRNLIPEKNITVPAKVMTRLENRILISDSINFTVSWKWIEWFNFSLHLSHVLLNYLETHHGGQWTVCVAEVFKVKSYAPHIDHLVFDVRCFPCSH